MLAIRRYVMRCLVALYIRMQAMLEDVSGATMVEYALMVAFVAMVAVAAVATLGTNLNTRFASFTGLFP